MNMGSDEFRFKRFTVRQAGAAMKVGTDGVVLGGWCPVEPWMRSVLDIGTGTGLVALMVVQRGEAWIERTDAVEIDRGSYEQACENFAASPWSDRLTAYHAGIQDFVRGGWKYDLVVSNPPYFVGSLLPPDPSRTTARHTTELTYGDLMRCAAESLADSGAFCMIMPYDQATAAFLADAAAHGLHLHERTDVHTTPAMSPKRTLLTFRKALPARPPEPRRMVIEEGGRHEYSEKYRTRLKDFLLKF